VLLSMIGCGLMNGPMSIFWFIISLCVSHSNVASKVHLKEENKYLMFFQKKYGLDKPAYATIGGLFNKGETATECAMRELLEETGLVTKELISLGKYRVQVNRGGGYLYAYLAKNCVRSLDAKPSDDYEKQEKRLVTKDELIGIALRGDVGEAQWVATVALGLLHESFSEKTFSN
jgi:ADP-ribose pyrophosphatase YjhB (NUDIX family)